MDDGQPTLITIAVSHYCELARWALQRAGVQYKEEAHAPGFHSSPAKGAGGKGTTPVLRLPGGGCVDESLAILRWADEQRTLATAAAGTSSPPPLFPPASDPCSSEVERLCELFGRRLGPAVRVWAYSHLLPTAGLAKAMAAPPIPLHEQWAMWLGGWAVLRRLMAKYMKINPTTGAAALKRIQDIFSEVGDMLADGRPYLTGPAFTAADMSLAALAAPALGLAYASAPGLSDHTPPAMRTEIEALRGTPAGALVMRLWEDERGGTEQRQQQQAARQETADDKATCAN